MTTERTDGERALRSWFDEGPSVMPDRVIDVITDRIAVVPQRSAWRLRGRLSMNTPIKLAAGLAAVLVVSFAAWQVLPGRYGPGVAPTPSPSPTATPAALPEGTLAAGTYRLHPFDAAALTIDATVPGGGWQGGPPNGLGKNDSNGPKGTAIGFLRAETIFSDPCHWDKNGSGSAPQPGDIAVGPTVADLAGALAANSAYESTTPVDATLGGFSGKRLELQLTPGASGCDKFSGDQNQYFVFGGLDGGFYAQGDDNRWQVTIVDVGGTRLIVVLLSYAETPAEDLSAAQGILDSVVINP